MSVSIFDLYCKLEKASDRRKILVHEMGRLFRNKINCFSCQGVCCTFVANSMQITLIEAFDIYFFLKENYPLNHNWVLLQT